MSKFRKGTRVNIISGRMKGSSGIVKESYDISNGTEYHIILDGESQERIYYEHNLDYEDIMDVPLCESCEKEIVMENEIDIMDMEIDDGEEDVTENTLLDNDIMNEELDLDIDVNDNSILLLEMAGRIPGEIFVDKKGKRRLIIAVGSNETRGVAHFHVFRNKVDWRNWKNGACLMFKKNKYFDHKDNSETLTKDELEVVIRCLKSKPAPDLVGGNNWQFLISLWNSNNYDWKIDINTPIQEYDYDTITRYKEDQVTENSISEELDDYDIMNEELDDYESYNEMATITRDIDRKGNILIAVNPERDRLSIPYFKVYDSDDILTAERVIRLHFKDSGMEYHKDKYKEWVLNADDKKHIIRVLQKTSKRFKAYTNWQYMCFQWNYENNLIDDDIAAYFNGDYDKKYENHPNSALKEAYVPSIQKMSDTWVYDSSKRSRK